MRGSGPYHQLVQRLGRQKQYLLPTPRIKINLDQRAHKATQSILWKYSNMTKREQSPSSQLQATLIKGAKTAGLVASQRYMRLYENCLNSSYSSSSCCKEVHFTQKNPLEKNVSCTGLKDENPIETSMDSSLLLKYLKSDKPKSQLM